MSLQATHRCNSIKTTDTPCHVPISSSELFPSHRRVKTNFHCQHRCVHDLNPDPCIFSDADTSSVSSGHSSPQSSYIFSSSASASSRSPPSSQNSFTELSPRPIQSVRRLPRIQVSSLLADSHTVFVVYYPFPWHTSCLMFYNRTYHLDIVQHPLKTAEFGTASLSRLPLTPPIVAQLIVRDPSGNSVVPYVSI